MPLFARLAWCALPLGVFLAIHFATWATPGFYMDAVNPDYMLVRLLYGAGNFPIWIIPGNLVFRALPLLVQVYHGSLTVYVGLPIYALFGTDLFGARVVAAWFGLLSLVALAVYLRSLRAGWLIVCLLLLCLATDPAFILNFRTQFYITALPAALILVCLALVSGAPSARRAALAGLLAGIAIYGYFIYAFPVALLGLVLLFSGLGLRAKLAWAAGVAAGLSLYALGYALVFLQAGSVAAFLDTMRMLVSGQDAARSTLGIAERLTRTVMLARLGLDNGGNTAMVLGHAMPPSLPQVRLLLLGVAVLGLGLAPVLRPELRRMAFMLAAVVLGFLALGLVFGDRLWAHHFSSMPVWFVAALGFGMTLCWRLPRVGPALCSALVAALVASNLLSWRVVARDMELTGGRNLFSDGIVRFAESAARDPRRPLVVAADWGILMPFVMVAQGAVPVTDAVNPAALRSRLCSGGDVTIAIMVARGTERIGAWTAEIRWGEPSLETFTQRDGVPLLLAATWRGNRTPDSASC
jgi:hypothetical protein